MPGVDEVVGDHPAGELVIAGDRRVAGRAAHHEHVRHAERGDPVDVVPVAVGIADEQPVDPPREEEFDTPALRARLVAGAGDEHVVAALDGVLVDLLVDHRLGDVRERVGDHADRAGAAAAQACREWVGAVAELRCGRVHEHGGRVAAGLAPQRPRHRRRVQAGALGEGAERRPARAGERVGSGWGGHAGRAGSEGPRPLRPACRLAAPRSTPAPWPGGAGRAQSIGRRAIRNRLRWADRSNPRAGRDWIDSLGSMAATPAIELTPKTKRPVGEPCCEPVVYPEVDRERAARLATVAKALGDPIRLQLIDVLRTHAGKVCVCELVPLFDVSQPTLSHHLKKLRDAGLVDSERQASGPTTTCCPSASTSSAPGSAEPGRRDHAASSSARSAWTRAAISSRVARTASIAWPLGSGSSQSR